MTTFLLVILPIILILSLIRNVVDHHLIQSYKDYVKELERSEKASYNAYIHLVDLITNYKPKTDDTNKEQA